MGPRPTATSSRSAAIGSPPSTATRTPESVRSTPAKRAPVRTVMPRLRKARCSWAETASSSSGDQPRQRLDDRHLDPEGAPHAGELAADHPAAQHDHRVGDSLEAQRVLGGQHPLTVDLQARQRACVGAARQDDVAAGPALAGDLDGVGRDQPALALDDRDAAALDQPGQALEEPVDDAVLVGVDARHVDAPEAWPGRRTGRRPGWRRRPRRRAAAPWSGCSRRAGRCRRACPSPRARRRVRAGPRGGRRRSRRCPRRG